MNWLKPPAKKQNKCKAKTLQQIAAMNIHETREYGQSDTHTKIAEVAPAGVVYTSHEHGNNTQPQAWHNHKSVMKMTDDSVNHLTREQLRYNR